MSGEAILDYTKAEMERVAEAMSSIMAFMEADADGGRPEYQGKFQADIIEQSYVGLRDGMRVSYDVIRDRWNDILVNDLYQHDIRVCVDSFKSFREEVEAFDDSFCRNLDFAVTIFDDEWIARKYLEMVASTRDQCRYLTDFVEHNFIERHFGNDPFAGAARRFRNYFVGVSDDGLRKLVKEHIPLSRRTKWLGDRREATVFGQTLGLKCSLMNKSFFFPGKNGMPRDLNYSSDGTDLNFSSYDIAPILESLKPVIG